MLMYLVDTLLGLSDLPQCRSHFAISNDSILYFNEFQSQASIIKNKKWVPSWIELGGVDRTEMPPAESNQSFLVSTRDGYQRCHWYVPHHTAKAPTHARSEIRSSVAQFFKYFKQIFVLIENRIFEIGTILSGMAWPMLGNLMYRTTAVTAGSDLMKDSRPGDPQLYF